MPSEEEELIESVLRIKLASSTTLTAAQVHAALTAEGSGATFAQVKKAASKAAKRAPTAGADVQAAALADPPKPDAPRSKQELKKSAALEEGLKSAQVAMMGALKALHAERWMVALHGRPQDTKDFVDRAAALALSGLLEKGEAISRERVEADMASLHYMLMPGSPFVLSDEERAAAHAQLEKLEGIKKVVVRSSPGGAPFVSQPVFQGARQGFVFKTGDLGLGYYHEAYFAAAAACYLPAVLEPTPAEEEDEVAPVDPALRDIMVQVNHTSTKSLDRALAKANALAAAPAGGIDDID